MSLKWSKNGTAARHEAMAVRALAVEPTWYNIIHCELINGEMRMEVTLKPMPAEELDQDGKALEVLGATSRPDTIGVSWRGLDEEFPSAADAMDRQDQLEDRGIEAEMFEVVAGRRRRIA
jgi:hypothetical protein